MSNAEALPTPKPKRDKRPLLVDQLRELLRAQRKPIPNRDKELFDKLNDVANDYTPITFSKPKAAKKETVSDD